MRVTNGFKEFINASDLAPFQLYQAVNDPDARVLQSLVARTIIMIFFFICIIYIDVRVVQSQVERTMYVCVCEREREREREPCEEWTLTSHSSYDSSSLPTTALYYHSL
jgi:antirestriction protein